MDKEEKTSLPTKAAKIDKGIWRIEYKIVHIYITRTSSEKEK